MSQGDIFYHEISIRQSIHESDNAKDYLKSIGKMLTRFVKAKKCEYLSLFDKTKYDGVSGVRQHITTRKKTVLRRLKKGLRRF